MLWAHACVRIQFASSCVCISVHPMCLCVCAHAIACLCICVCVCACGFTCACGYALVCLCLWVHAWVGESVCMFARVHVYICALVHPKPVWSDLATQRNQPSPFCRHHWPVDSTAVGWVALSTARHRRRKKKRFLPPWFISVKTLAQGRAMPSLQGDNGPCAQLAHKSSPGSLSGSALSPRGHIQPQTFPVTIFAQHVEKKN